MSAAPLVVTIDGPAGVGKSTIATRLAEELGWAYLDSGLHYRILTLTALGAGVDPSDEAALVTCLAEGVLPSPDTAARLRGPEVTAAVPLVAAHPRVRELVVALQRRFAAEAGRVVAEGRDTGTVVFPDARVKVYLDADPAERARRRLAQDAGGGRIEDAQALAATRSRLDERDQRDRTRAVAPLRPAADAWILDTTRMTLDEVYQAVLSHVRSGIPVASDADSPA